jgi:hypothetical protein
LIARVRRPAIALAAAAIFLGGLVPSALAADFSVTTPYPSIAVAPGSTASFDLTITSPRDGTVDLASRRPDGRLDGNPPRRRLRRLERDRRANKAGSARSTSRCRATVTDGEITVTASGCLHDDLDLNVKASTGVAGDITLTTVRRRSPARRLAVHVRPDR